MHNEYRTNSDLVAASGKFSSAFNVLVATELARTMQADGLAVVGQLVSSLMRRCVEDVIPQWERVVSTLGLKLTAPTVLSAKGLVNHYSYTRAVETLLMAMRHAADATGPLKWQHADTAIRLVVWLEANLQTAITAECLRDAIRDGLDDDAETVERIRRHEVKAAQLRAWAEGVR